MEYLPFLIRCCFVTLLTAVTRMTRERDLNKHFGINIFCGEKSCWTATFAQAREVLN